MKPKYHKLVSNSSFLEKLTVKDKYYSNLEKLVVKSIKPQRRVMFHLTTKDNTTKILSEGFCINKPKFMRPRTGYDSMYSLEPLRKIWVIPSSARVYPSFLITLK